MKLQLRIDRKPCWLPGGGFLALCDEAGKPLPGMVAVEFKQELEDCPLITVTFRVDGDQIRFAD